VNGIPVDTLEKWLSWAYSTDEGLWENDVTKSVELETIDTYGGEADLMPPFFSANFITIHGDTIYIADGSQEALVAMNCDGEQLWITGQLGEGPGSFAMIGSLDRYSDVIAVCNNANSRLDFFSPDGAYLSSIPVSSPQSVVLLSDSTGLERQNQNLAEAFTCSTDMRVLKDPLVKVYGICFQQTMLERTFSLHIIKWDVLHVCLSLRTIFSSLI